MFYSNLAPRRYKKIYNYCRSKIWYYKQYNKKKKVKLTRLYELSEKSRKNLTARIKLKTRRQGFTEFPKKPLLSFLKGREYYIKKKPLNKNILKNLSDLIKSMSYKKVYKNEKLKIPSIPNLKTKIPSIPNLKTKVPSIPNLRLKNNRVIDINSRTPVKFKGLKNNKVIDPTPKTKKKKNDYSLGQVSRKLKKIQLNSTPRTYLKSRGLKNNKVIDPNPKTPVLKLKNQSHEIKNGTRMTKISSNITVSKKLNNRKSNPIPVKLKRLKNKPTSVKLKRLKNQGHEERSLKSYYKNKSIKRRVNEKRTKFFKEIRKTKKSSVFRKPIKIKFSRFKKQTKLSYYKKRIISSLKRRLRLNNLIKKVNLEKLNDSKKINFNKIVKKEKSSPLKKVREKENQRVIITIKKRLNKVKSKPKYSKSYKSTKILDKLWKNRIIIDFLILSQMELGERISKNTENKRISSYVIGVRNEHAVYSLIVIQLGLRLTLKAIAMRVYYKKKIIINFAKPNDKLILTPGFENPSSKKRKPKKYRSKKYKLKNLYRKKIFFKQNLENLMKKEFLVTFKKWTGGLLTNFKRVSKRIISKIKNKSTISNKNNDFRASFPQDIPKIPSFMVSTNDNHWVLNESKRLNIPTTQLVEVSYNSYHFGDINIPINTSYYSLFSLTLLLKECMFYSHHLDRLFSKRRLYRRFRYLSRKRIKIFLDDDEDDKNNKNNNSNTKDSNIPITTTPQDNIPITTTPQDLAITITSKNNLGNLTPEDTLNTIPQDTKFIKPSKVKVSGKSKKAYSKKIIDSKAFNRLCTKYNISFNFKPISQNMVKKKPSPRCHRSIISVADDSIFRNTFMILLILGIYMFYYYIFRGLAIFTNISSILNLIILRAPKNLFINKILTLMLKSKPFNKLLASAYFIGNNIRCLNSPFYDKIILPIYFVPFISLLIKLLFIMTQKYHLIILYICLLPMFIIAIGLKICILLSRVIDRNHVILISLTTLTEIYDSAKRAWGKIYEVATKQKISPPISNNNQNNTNPESNNNQNSNSNNKQNNDANGQKINIVMTAAALGFSGYVYMHNSIDHEEQMKQERANHEEQMAQQREQMAQQQKNHKEQMEAIEKARRDSNKRHEEMLEVKKIKINVIEKQTQAIEKQTLAIEKQQQILNDYNEIQNAKTENRGTKLFKW